MQTFTIALLMLLSTFGPAMVIAVVGYAAIKGIARNPAATPRIMLSMITAFVFAETIAVLALLIVYNLFK
ncbi:MAG: ATP synthase F0 subunit C [Candidatus Omnitrophica bacterium]|nr:ATP synthase F0 subunit C [Candidatus Omnitrophota bacterium]